MYVLVPPTIEIKANNRHVGVLDKVLQRILRACRIADRCTQPTVRTSALRPCFEWHYCDGDPTASNNMCRCNAPYFTCNATFFNSIDTGSTAACTRSISHKAAAAAAAPMGALNLQSRLSNFCVSVCTSACERVKHAAGQPFYSRQTEGVVVTSLWTITARGAASAVC